MKQKQKWQIDDLVYFLPETAEHGEFPDMWRGTVEEIKRTCVRVKVAFAENTVLLWINNDRLFASADALSKALCAHLAKQAYICDNPDKVYR